MEGTVAKGQQVSLAVSETDVPASWPAAGRCVFTNVCVRYRHGLPLTLRGVTLTIQGGHRVGTLLRQLSQLFSRGRVGGVWNALWNFIVFVCRHRRSHGQRQVDAGSGSLPHAGARERLHRRRRR